MTITISIAVGLTLVTVIALTGLSYAAQKALFSHKDGALTLDGHRAAMVVEDHL